MENTGYIHSVETFGTVDGPGIRYVLFLQGCHLRCKFCHNPDSWRIGAGKKMTADELTDDIKKYLPYFKASGGGVTASGGEPLLQAEFLLTLFKKLKGLNIHTAIDTSGFAEVEKVKELLNYTDLVLLSIKHADPEKYPEICGGSSKRPHALARYLTRINKPVWIRYVVIPGLTDDKESLNQLNEWIKPMENVVKLELLPYHTMGVYKWEQLGIPYPLAKPGDDYK
ncbi:MAG TPA: pyruvate formate-lyase-activating protein [Syntrophomonadaceae bacterium]|nr:pyruvate formate-lyase-activating protein [Syntrophomonadaceae bacterium]